MALPAGLLPQNHALCNETLQRFVARVALVVSRPYVGANTRRFSHAGVIVTYFFFGRAGFRSPVEIRLSRDVLGVACADSRFIVLFDVACGTRGCQQQSAALISSQEQPGDVSAFTNPTHAAPDRRTATMPAPVQISRRESAFSPE